MKQIKQLVIGLVLAAAAVGVQASAKFSITGASNAKPSTFEQGAFGIAGLDLASLGMSLSDLKLGGTLSVKGGRDDVSYQFLGSEASYNNFFVRGANVFKNATSQVGSSFTNLNVTGALDFAFLSQGNAAQKAVNGGINAGRIGTILSGDKRSVLITFNDFAADKDFDDMAILASFVPAPVPEPVSYVMLMAGMLTMGFIARRRMGANIR
ncbi:PEP-CTERM sorting domain-containing protein [Chitinimonas arctica]|nr:PEP-CTERM sorting domain-containing protein [Chitinimonas arctica]